MSFAVVSRREYFAYCFDMKNVVVDSISRYTDGDVYKHHIFGVFVVNDFK